MRSKPSPLVESGWPTVSYARITEPNCEVIAAVNGPYESKFSRKRSHEKAGIEVVVSHYDFSKDCSDIENLIKGTLTTVIQLSAYPYLTICISVQILHGEHFTGACINAAFQAVRNAGISLTCDLLAATIVHSTGVLDLGIVPNSDLILFSRSTGSLRREDFERYIREIHSIGTI